MEPKHFSSPEKRQFPDQIPSIQVVRGISLHFCWDLLMSHNFLSNQVPKKKKKYYQIPWVTAIPWELHSLVCWYGRKVLGYLETHPLDNKRETWHREGSGYRGSKFGKIISTCWFLVNLVSPVWGVHFGGEGEERKSQGKKPWKKIEGIYSGTNLDQRFGEVGPSGLIRERGGFLKKNRERNAFYHTDGE